MNQPQETLSKRLERLSKLLPYPQGQEQIVQELTQKMNVGEDLSFGESRLLADAKSMLVQYRRNFMRRSIIQGGKQ